MANTIEIETPGKITDDATPADVLPLEGVRWISHHRTEAWARKAADKIGASRIFHFPGTSSSAARFYVGVEVVKVEAPEEKPYTARRSWK